MPFWLYAWGAASALIVSFLIVGWFFAQPRAPAADSVRDISGARWVSRLRRVLPALRILSLLLLALCIATGWFGTRDPYRNFSMTAFWIWFVLGFAYLTIVIGDLYAQLNPWRTLADGCSRLVRDFARGRTAYPERLAYWPALALYYLFICFELFGHGHPSTLASALFAYTLMNLAGVWLLGAPSWFRYCEFFSVFFRLIALAAPIDHCRAAAAGGRGSLQQRAPFSGLSRERAGDLSEVTFLLFMLSSTAFDGLRATQTWVNAFWNSAWLRDWLGRPPLSATLLLRPWYDALEKLTLALSPFLYLGAYLAALAMARAATRSQRPLRELALDFAYTLLPIALVYNFTHYYTLLLSQGPKIVGLLSDPFGWSWNLFGTAQRYGAPFLPDPGWVWHTQVVLIVLGHVLSVVLAHRVALRVFPNRRAAVLSQLPMLGLMVLFTVVGLWILAQPLQAIVSR